MYIGIILNSANEMRTVQAPTLESLALQPRDPDEDLFSVPAEIMSWPNLNPDPLRDVLWEQVKTLRDQKEYGGCTVTINGIDYPLQTDERSQNLIGRAVLLANTIGASFAEVWTMGDEREASINQGGMITIGLTLGAHVSACRARARALRAALYDSNADVPTLLRIDINAGWPT